MVRTCAFDGCRSTTGLHSFPSDPHMARKWLQMAGRCLDRDTAAMYICNRHFSRECYSNYTEVELGFVSTRHLRLTPSAVPNPANFLPIPTPSRVFKEVACQTACKGGPGVKETATQTCPVGRHHATVQVNVKPFRRSKGTQARPRREVCAEDSRSHPEGTESSTDGESADEVVVKLECLLQLFQKCLACCSECSISTERDGWFFYVTQKCQQCHYSRNWVSHPTDQIIRDPADSQEVVETVIMCYGDTDVESAEEEGGDVVTVIYDGSDDSMDGQRHTSTEDKDDPDSSGEGMTVEEEEEEDEQAEDDCDEEWVIKSEKAWSRSGGEGSTAGSKPEASKEPELEPPMVWCSNCNADFTRSCYGLRHRRIYGCLQCGTKHGAQRDSAPGNQESNTNQDTTTTTITSNNQDTTSNQDTTTTITSNNQDTTSNQDTTTNTTSNSQDTTTTTRNSNNQDTTSSNNQDTTTTITSNNQDTTSSNNQDTTTTTSNNQDTTTTTNTTSSSNQDTTSSNNQDTTTTTSNSQDTTTTTRNSQDTTTTTNTNTTTSNQDTTTTTNTSSSSNQAHGALNFQKLAVCFGDLDSFQKHARQCHGIKQFREPCPDCGKFITMRNKVSGGPPHTCEHKARPNSCLVCGKGFRSPKGLLKHMTWVHKGKPNIVRCNYCLKRFTFRKQKIEHEKIHQNEELKFSCTHCPLRFPDCYSRSAHRKTHRVFNTFVCKVCERSFTQAYSLERHMAIHRGLKPYSCELCDRTFNQSGHLKSHMRVHTGEKPFKCQDCGQCFNHNVSLKNHTQRHHGPGGDEGKHKPRDEEWAWGEEEEEEDG